jgi:surface antigen
MTLRIGKRAALALMVAAGLVSAMPASALQCVPYARAASGIDLRGDAWRWWNAAAGVYERGHAPRLGAVIVFQKFGKMRLGHVAVVQQMVNSREILIDHANWGNRHTGRGRVAKMVSVRDVSPRNDWTRVQVWNEGARDYGPRAYPTYGFIYPHDDVQVSDALFSMEMPEDVAALMAASDMAPSDKADGLLTDMVSYSFVASVPAPPSATPAPVTVAQVDDVDETTPSVVAFPAVTTPVTGRLKGTWDGDRQAALRAGSGHY